MQLNKVCSTFHFLLLVFPSGGIFSHISFPSPRWRRRSGLVRQKGKGSKIPFDPSSGGPRNRQKKKSLTPGLFFFLLAYWSAPPAGADVGFFLLVQRHPAPLPPSPEKRSQPTRKKNLPRKVKQLLWGIFVIFAPFFFLFSFLPNPAID